MAQQLEQEVKLEVRPGWVVPDLTGVIPGAQAVALPALAMEATYYDTADLRLARQQVTLRLRRETPLGAGQEGAAPELEEWTLKLPSSTDGGVLARQEMTWPAEPTGARSRRRPGPRGSAAGARRQAGQAGQAGLAVPTFPTGEPRGAVPVHSEPAQLVRAVTLGMPLVPVAYLATVRERTSVQTSDGRHLAEVDHDSVAGRCLLTGGATTNGNGAGPGAEPPPVTRFDEVEVELAQGSALEVLDAVADRLRSAGARPSKRVSKLKEVLGDTLKRAGPPLTGLPDRSRPRPTLLADVLQQQADACLNQLLEHDLALRTEDPDLEHVHKARVAVRRFRTVLRSFHRHLHRASVEPPPAVTAWLASLETELRWLASVLGQARDADVRLASVEQRCLALPLADADGSNALIAAARADRELAHCELLHALAEERYVEVVRMLDALSGPGLAGGRQVRSPNRPGVAAGSQVPAQLWDRLTGGAATGTRLMTKREWRALHKAVKRLDSAPSDPALHRVRIKAKRFRYLAEVAGPLCSADAKKAAESSVEVATQLQDILGQLHDDVVTEGWLRHIVDADPGHSTATALAAGQLVAIARQGQEQGRETWGASWQRLNTRKLISWLN